MSDIIDLNGVSLAEGNLGETWLDFTATCTPAAAILFNDAYNLITITFLDNFLDTTITNVLIDESMEVVNKQAYIRKYLIETLVDALQMIGIIIDQDYTTPDSIKDLNFILNSIYELDGMEDIIGMLGVLEDEELDTKDRFIKLLEKLDPGFDTENFCYLINDVAPNVTKGILIGLNILGQDDTDYMEPALRRRIVANKVFLDGTLAKTHITKGGAAGLDIEPLTNLFINELGMILVDDTNRYLKELLALMIIGNLTDQQIQTQFLAAAEQFGDSIDSIYKAQALLNEVEISV